MKKTMVTIRELDGSLIMQVSESQLRIPLYKLKQNKNIRVETHYYNASVDKKYEDKEFGRDMDRLTDEELWDKYPSGSDYTGLFDNIK